MRKTKFETAVALHVGQKIKELREEHKVSLRRLADYLSIAFQTISSYERGKASIQLHHLVMCAEYLDVNISYFFEDIDSSQKRVETYEEYIIKKDVH